MSRAGQPPVTVVIPVWDDYVDYLVECVSAVPTWAKVVVVDNASHRPLPPLPDAVAVIRLDRRCSAGEARNAGLATVTSDLVVFADADDVSLPGAIELLASTLAREPSAVAAIGRLVSWDPTNGAQELSSRLPRPVTIRASRHRRLFALANVALNTFPIAGGIFRTAAVRAAGGYGDSNVGEDWILGAALCFQGRVLLMDEPTTLRRVHGNSLWYRPHTRAELRFRAAELRRRLRTAPAVPLHGRLAASASLPAHELVTLLSTRGGLHTPARPLVAS